ARGGELRVGVERAAELRRGAAIVVLLEAGDADVVLAPGALARARDVCGLKGEDGRRRAQCRRQNAEDQSRARHSKRVRHTLPRPGLPAHRRPARDASAHSGTIRTLYTLATG